jgi:alanine-synthesizing transaminase
MPESKRIRRLPPYLFARVNQLKMEARREGRDVIDLGMGNPDQPPAPQIIEKLSQVAHDPKAHRYSASRGIPHLRQAICQWYEKKFGVVLDPEKEAIAVIGAKEGINHLALALLNEEDLVMVPNPTYPTHLYSVTIAGGNLYSIPLRKENNWVPDLEKIPSKIYSRAKILLLNYPHNPTTQVVDLDFFKEVVDFAKKRDLIVVHDFAYADVCFENYEAPSFLQVKGAKKIGVEFYSLTKGYNMAGWRIGFAVGNRKIISALAKLKSYYDYGIFTPIQVAGIIALKEPHLVKRTVEVYQRRRDVLVQGLRRIGWEVPLPKATLYVWASLPEKFRKMGSMQFSLMLLEKGDVALSPGIGYGKYGEGYLRFALVENEQRIRQAVRGIKKVLEG